MAPTDNYTERYRSLPGIAKKRSEALMGVFSDGEQNSMENASVERLLVGSFVRLVELKGRGRDDYEAKLLDETAGNDGEGKKALGYVFSGYEESLNILYAAGMNSRIELIRFASFFSEGFLRMGIEDSNINEYDVTKYSLHELVDEELGRALLAFWNFMPMRETNRIMRYLYAVKNGILKFPWECLEEYKLRFDAW